jgi:hypothetical protein
MILFGSSGLRFTQNFDGSTVIHTLSAVNASYIAPVPSVDGLPGMAGALNE